MTMMLPFSVLCALTLFTTVEAACDSFFEDCDNHASRSWAYFAIGVGIITLILAATYFGRARRNRLARQHNLMYIRGNHQQELPQQYAGGAWQSQGVNREPDAMPAPPYAPPMHYKAPEATGGSPYAPPPGPPPPAGLTGYDAANAQPAYAAPQYPPPTYAQV